MKNKFEQTSQPIPEQIRERMLKEPEYLPSHGDIRIAFPTQKEWSDYRVEVDFHELLNKEFLAALSDYLAKRITAYGGTKEHPVVILEAGAGDGRLTHFLCQGLEERTKGKFRIVAVDIGEWIPNPPFPVENIDYKEALKEHKPAIVICSWMRPRTDWTADFRGQKSVKEYILIGEKYGGASGRDWETWGVKLNVDSGGPIERLETAPYKVDGFESFDLEDISQHQIACTDYPPLEHEHSHTVSFRRKS